MSSSDDAAGPSSPKRRKTDYDQLYAKSYIRVSKDNLYMIIALWMEDFLDKLPGSTDETATVKPYRNVGAVLVLPNDVIFAADCSRDGVHAVARLLMMHPEKAKGCKMFMSRKPCPICAKLLVQSKVHRVLYLPFQVPEYYDDPKADSMMKQVENMFSNSAIAQTKFVFQVEKAVLDHAELKTPSAKKNKAVKNEIKKEKEQLASKYAFDKDWMASVDEKLPWPAFDADINGEVHKYFDYAMEWMARANVLSGKGLKYKFERYQIGEQSENPGDFNPEPRNPKHVHEKQARHFIAIARFLAERTDDPRRGVGAVIVSPDMKILSFGWNGFPFNAQYGEFARASEKDESAADKKYPYVLHAEQNALLMRNTKNIKDAILFATKTPCDECAPLLLMQGIKTVVVDEDKKESSDGETSANGLSYGVFRKMVEKGNFVCYQTKKDGKES